MKVPVAVSLGIAAVALWAAPRAVVCSARADEPVGQRPYEMVWADRTQDTRPPLVDFEDLTGWTVEVQDAEATWQPSREQLIWGEGVAKLTYRGTGAAPKVVVRPPAPIAAQGPIDCVNLWLYGNNWGWAPDPTTPQIQVTVVLQGSGEPVRIGLGGVRWKEWWLMHHRLAPEQTAALGDRFSLVALEFTGGRNRDDRVVYLDNLAVYREELPPLAFAPRPARGIEPFPGQGVGTNTGPGRLPFPNREETILPDQLTPGFKTSVAADGEAYRLEYRGPDGHLVYRIQPATGTLADVTAQWEGLSEAFTPMAGGGVLLAGADGAPRAVERAEPLGTRQEDDRVVSRWRCHAGEQSAEVEYTYRLWQKSLVIDVRSLGGAVAEVRFGRATGIAEPRLVTLPYLVCDQERPAVLVMGSTDRPLFLMGLVDCYRSNASQLWADNAVEPAGVAYNGGARYLPRTDGKRNDCFERLFLTVSPRFEEMLPNVPNPKSPWMHVAGERLWRAHGASDRQADYDLWKRVARYGMTKVVITDHEVGWRDGGESFTFRTRAAPGKGGDEGQADYARKLHALGFRYGIYNNYTDYAPVNEFWNEDFVTRLADGAWQPAWPRCYNPKPSRAVEMEARLAPIIQEKFQLDTAYCDVHTAVRPWQYCDFDARVPGAATFAATLYAYGEIMLHQKKTWNGPVYSEGNNHWYYCGLTDGNYGQDQAARLAERPWLVDFDLRKLHPLCCNFGMGNPGMFFGRGEGLGATPAEQERQLDQFLAATLAFGHTGFLVMEGGMPNAVRSYFTLQQIHAAYAQETATEIRYADEAGNLLDTSAAVATGAWRRSQIATRYTNGLRVIVNGNPNADWKVNETVLPPFGWMVEDPRDEPLVAFSATVDGHRADYVDSPAYLYADGRGKLTRFAKAMCDGPLIVHKRADGTREAIPLEGCSVCGIALDGQDASAEALDADGKSLGEAETRFARGMVHVVPKSGAFSYVLTPRAAPAVTLRAERFEAVPGETVTIAGSQEHPWTVPTGEKVGGHVWQSFENAWIDFEIVPLADTALALDGGIALELVPHVGAATAADVTLNDAARKVELRPGEPLRLDFPWQQPADEAVQEVKLAVSAGPMRVERSWWLKSERTTVPAARLPETFTAGQALRGGPETAATQQNRGYVRRGEETCGGEARTGLFMHPPYDGGVGYAFARFDGISLPAAPPAAFRTAIGKADGSDVGDGILFRVLVIDPAGKETLLAERSWKEHVWVELEGDLAPWAGQTVSLKLVADVGPADNSTGDWACWADMRIESCQPQLLTTVHDAAVRLRYEPAPHPQSGLSEEDLRKASKATLHFRAIGLQCGGQYVAQGRLNGIAVGDLPEAGGDEANGVWADGLVDLPAEAIATLAASNTFAVDNPGGDCFKIGEVWIDLVLADGRQASSRVATTVFTQPAEWKHAEGVGVPADGRIELEVRFVLEP